MADAHEQRHHRTMSAQPKPTSAGTVIRSADHPIREHLIAVAG